MSNDTARDKQVGGDHYKNMKLQPLELTYIVGGSPVFCKVAKYITRKKDDRKLNLEKAIHCLQFEFEHIQQRVENYKVYLPTYEGEDIKEFASQFHHEDFVFRVLTMTMNGFLQEAADLIDEFIANEDLTKF